MQTTKEFTSSNVADFFYKEPWPNASPRLRMLKNVTVHERTGYKPHETYYSMCIKAYRAQFARELLTDFPFLKDIDRDTNSLKKKQIDDQIKQVADDARILEWKLNCIEDIIISSLQYTKGRKVSLRAAIESVRVQLKSNSSEGV